MSGFRSCIKALAATVCLACAVGAGAGAPVLPTLTVRGADLVDPSGRVVTLRGCNLGNWLLIEPWMLGLPQHDAGAGGGYPDQATVFATLRDRFGEARFEALIETYRVSYITPRDMEIVASFGFNAVRLPFHYSVLEDDDAPLGLKPDAFRWIDHAVSMAADAGLYVILDLHGVPGGQSVDAPTGRVGQNHLWTDPECQRRLVRLWGELAERYAGNPTVAAYDVVNEPFGDFKTNISPVMFDLFGRIYDAIRAVDPDTLIYAPGTLQGIGFYGDPAAHGWTHVGFTEHAYPGLFGWGEASLRGHARFLGQWVGGKARYLEPLDVPYLVGEFNVVFAEVGGARLMRRYFDAFAERGWAATMWSYKLLRPEGGMPASNWSLATNEQPFDLRDLDTVDYETLRDRFTSLATMPLAIDEELRSVLRSADPGLELPSVEVLFEAPGDDEVAGWRGVDIGGATPGGERLDGGGTLVVYGGGDDLFGRHDAFRFLCRPAGGDESVFTRVDALDWTDRFAKAGVMLRAGLAEDAPHVLVHTTPTGRVVLAHRDEAGGLTFERTLGVTGFPVGLGLTTSGDELTVHWTDPEGAWHEQRQPLPEVIRGDEAVVGLAVLAHDRAALTAARVTVPGPERPQVTPFAQGASFSGVLRNGSFEDAAAGAPDQAEGWNRWGQWMNRETGWTPVRDGQSILTYQHWQIGAGDSSGVWQDVTSLVPGQSYRFSVYANLDAGEAGGHPPAAVELRVESAEPDGTMLTVATDTWQAHELATGDGWSLLSLEAEAMREGVRVLLVVYPHAEGPRDGALKFDSAAVTSTEPQ